MAEGGDGLVAVGCMFATTTTRMAVSGSVWRTGGFSGGDAKRRLGTFLVHRRKVFRR